MSLFTLDSILGQKLEERRLLAVVSINDPDSAVPLAEALLRGGVDIIELTLRTPGALEAAANILSDVPEMTVGTGTVLSVEQVDEVLEIGADFAVSPSVNVDVIRYATECGLPFSPGIMTPTDIDVSIQEGCDLLKFFPATSSGGIPHLKNIATPFAHLGLGFIPLGGVNLENLASWLNSPFVTAVGGSWLAPISMIDECAWDRIEANAKQARVVIDGIASSNDNN